MACRALCTAILCCLVPTRATGATAQGIDLRVTCVARSEAAAQTLECVVDNVGSASAHELWAELWRSPADPTFIAEELAAGGQATFSWQMSPQLWTERYRQVGAIRLRYRDSVGGPASLVLAVGASAPVSVEPPRWPSERGFRLRWEGSRPAPVGTVHWWGPAELAVLGPAGSSTAGVDGTASDLAELTARLSPSSRIQGWESSLYAIILPDPPASGVAESPGMVVRIELDARQPEPLWQPEPRELALYAVLCLALWLSAAALAAWVGGGFAGRLTATAPLLVLAVGFGAVILAVFPLNLLGLATTPAGGDYPGHLNALDFAAAELLPSGRLYGWYPYWFGGFPLFLHYFPLVFVLAAALGVALPAGLALRLAGLAGVLLLPPAWFLTMRWLKAPRAAAWCAAIGSVWLLFIEEQTIWGGNLASMLSGEIAYALSYPLAWLALAWAWNRADRTAGWWWLAVLLALTGLSHAYPLVFVTAVIPLLALRRGRWAFRSWNIARAGLLAFGLLAWWLVPLAWNLPWTVVHRENWPVRMAQAFPPVLWPAYGLAAVWLGASLWRSLLGPRNDDGESRRSGAGFLLVVGLAAIVLYELAYSFGMQNIRMLPFAHGAVVLLGSWQLGAWLEWRAGSPAGALPAAADAAGAAASWPLRTAAIMGLMCAWALWQADFVPAWARWNLNGLERTPWWEDFSGAMDLVEGDAGDAAVIAQFDHDNELAGSERVFELIPHFAGRATPEGLYIQSASLAPAMYWLQSQLTRFPSCPIFAYDCGDYRPEAALESLRVLGIGTVIAYSQDLDAFLAADPGYYRLGRSGVYGVYQLAHPVPLVEPARHQPVISRSADWRREGYDWLRAGTDLEVPLVIGAGGGRWPHSVDRYRPRQLPWVAYPDPPSVAYRIAPGRIDIENARPGHPLIVKAAYHPGWKADDSSPIEMIAPGLMLVTPLDSSVSLRWSSGAAGLSGILLTLLTWVYLGWHLLWRRKPRRQPGLARISHRPSPAAAALATNGDEMCWLDGVAFDRTGRIVTILAAAALAIIVYVRHPPLAYERIYADGMQRLRDGAFEAAGADFERLLRVSTPHRLRDDAAVQLGVNAAAAGDLDGARAHWLAFLRDFAVSPRRAEVLVRLAGLDADAGDTAAARRRLEQALVAPLGQPEWLDRAHREIERLAEGSDPALTSSGRLH